MNFPLTRAFLIVAISAALQLHAVEIIGHRGASHDAPENTLASFNLGWKQGADVDELDIYLTKDKQVVVMHDKNTKRTTGVDGAIASRTLEELRALDAGSWKGAQWKGEKIPTLAEAIATIPDGKRMFIEIKCGAEVLPELERVLAASGKKPAQLAIIGFSYETMVAARKKFPQFPVLWIVGTGKKAGDHPPLDTLIEKAKAAGLNGLDLDYKLPIDAAFAAKAKAAGLQLYVWTVDDAAAAKRLSAAGVDGITTNRPGWMREQL